MSRPHPTALHAAADALLWADNCREAVETLLKNLRRLASLDAGFVSESNDDPFLLGLIDEAGHWSFVIEKLNAELEEIA